MKPTKPYPEFPLTPHVRGGWSKRYKGFQIYIPAADPVGALADFEARKRLIDRGRMPTRAVDAEGVTVGEVATRYARERMADRDAGRIEPGTYADYASAITEMVGVFGRDTRVDQLTPDDFTALFRKWETRMGSHALGRNVQAIRTLWRHADANDWIERLPRFGSMFRKPIRTKRAGKPLTVEQARKLVKAAAGQVKAMILLGLNCGFGSTDCADLPVDAVNLKARMILFPRPKMAKRGAIDRACPLWPETVAALRAIMPDVGLVFLTEKLHKPWVRTQTSRNGKISHIDAVAQEFAKVCEAAKIPRRGFYELRHLFRTIADELEKPNAVARIMGHRLAGMAEVYVDRVEHDRLFEVSDHVRSRVLGKGPKGRKSR